VREPTRKAALEAVRHIDPHIRAATVLSWHDAILPQEERGEPVPLEEQIFPTQLGLTFVYVPSSANARCIGILSRDQSNWQVSW
jgi:hypothetical protein